MAKTINYSYYYDLDPGNLAIAKDSVFDYLSKYNTLYLDCGRACLKAVAMLYNNAEVLLPDYTCSSVIQGFSSAGKLGFYHINDDFTIDFQSLEALITPKVKLVCVVQFGGKLLPKEQVKRLIELKNKYNFKIVEDATHSLLSAPLTFGDYGTCALYKWFPSPCGGVLYSKENIDNKLYENLDQRQDPQRVYAMIMQFFQRNGLMENTELISEYFNKFDRELTEKYNKTNYLTKMPDFDKFVLSCFSVLEIKNRRKSNVKALMENINFDTIKPVFNNISDNECMFIYPIYTDNRDSLKKHLAENKIFTAVYWNIKDIPLLCDNTISVKRSEKILALPVNHNYGIDDMVRMAELINKWQRIKC